MLNDGGHEWFHVMAYVNANIGQAHVLHDAVFVYCVYTRTWLNQWMYATALRSTPLSCERQRNCSQLCHVDGLFVQQRAATAAGAVWFRISLPMATSVASFSHFGLPMNAWWVSSGREVDTLRLPLPQPDIATLVPILDSFADVAVIRR